METYVSLIKGRGKEGSDKAAQEAIEKTGCKLVASYMLMGQYDILVIIEAPNAKAAAAAIWKARQVASVGESSSETMRAFSQKEIEEMRPLFNSE